MDARPDFLLLLSLPMVAPLIGAIVWLFVRGIRDMVDEL